MEIRQVWGVPRTRIEEFLRSKGLRETEPGLFRAESCEVRLTALPPRSMGVFSVSPTQLDFSGADDELAALHRRFTLQFLSAGA